MSTADEKKEREGDSRSSDSREPVSKRDKKVHLGEPSSGVLASIGSVLSGKSNLTNGRDEITENKPENEECAKTNGSCGLHQSIAEVCDLAISSAFGEDSKPTYRPIGSAADTAFSGSAVMELEITRQISDAPVNDRVVLKHSSVRTHAFDHLSSAEKQSSSKYAAALKTDRSSRNECAFLQAYWEALSTKTANKTRIPSLLYARDHPTNGVTLLLESLSSFGSNGDNRVNEIPLGPKTDAALEWLAHFHASFLPKLMNPNALDPFPLGDQSFLWSVGTHLSLEKRSKRELENLPKTLSEFLNRFQSTHEYFSTDSAKEQGTRIQLVADRVATSLHPDHCNPKHKTMVHGDYKQGNMFFASHGNKDDSIAVFDWQWTGPGVGATDLIYLCVMAVSQESLEDYETNILKPYHSYLLQALQMDSAQDPIANDMDELYPYDDLLKEFKLAAIDIQRWLGGSRYKSMSPESVSKAQQTIDVNHGIFRRSIPRLVWIFRIVDEALTEIETGKILCPNHGSSTSF